MYGGRASTVDGGPTSGPGRHTPIGVRRYGWYRYGSAVGIAVSTCFLVSVVLLAGICLCADGARIDSLRVFLPHCLFDIVCFTG